MSTRGLITFRGVEEGEQDWNVYKHSDMYPSGAADTLQVAQDWFAWKAPRYESDDFATSFIAASKAWYLFKGNKLDTENVKYHPGGEYNSMSGGGVRLMPQGNPTQIAVTNCGDIEYRYEVYEKKVRVRLMPQKTELWIKAFNGNWWCPTNLVTEKTIIECRLADFQKKAKAFDDKRHEAAAKARAFVNAT